MSAKNFMSYGDAETVFTAIANAIKNNEDAVAAVTSALTAIKDGTDLDSFGDVEVALLDKADTSDLGTAAAKDSTNSVTAGSTDLVESGAVKDAIDASVAAAYHHAGTKTVAQLTHDLLIAANEGNVYNITDSGTTTSDFIEGIGKQIDAGDNVGICKVGNVYMFDLLSGLEDTSGFVRKSQTTGLLKNDGTVNTTIEDTVAGHTTAIAGKQDKYETITYAQWQALTPEQQAAKDYYISDYPSSVLTAGNIAYDNTTSGMSANKVQGAIDELKSGLTDVQRNMTNVLTGSAAIQTDHNVHEAVLTRNGMIYVGFFNMTLTSAVSAWTPFAHVEANLKYTTLCNGAYGGANSSYCAKNGDMILTQPADAGTQMHIVLVGVADFT